MRWLKDPLVIFSLLGVGMFVLAGLDGDQSGYKIEVREADLKRLADQWMMQMRRPPNATELANLVEQHLKEEIYYRESLAMGLDANDTIVRRRMVQKLTFLTEDLATAQPPDEDTLQAYFAENADAYRIPDRYSFRHRYFSADRRDDAPHNIRLNQRNAMSH